MRISTDTSGGTGEAGAAQSRAVAGSGRALEPQAGSGVQEDGQSADSPVPGVEDRCDLNGHAVAAAQTTQAQTTQVEPGQVVEGGPILVNGHGGLNGQNGQSGYGAGGPGERGERGNRAGLNGQALQGLENGPLARGGVDWQSGQTGRAMASIRSGLSRAGQSLSNAGLAMTGGGDGDRSGGAATVRVDRRTKDLTKRLRPGEIAVIDHEDIDRIAAEGLIACRPLAVVNAAQSISGRYPNLGPEIIVSAGIPLIDDVGGYIMDLVREGESLRVDGNVLFRGDTPLVAGKLLDTAHVVAAMEEARAGLSDQLEAFVANTLEYLRKERDLLLDGIGVPDVRTDFDDKHVLIVVRGYHYREDLKALRPYIREYRPLLIGVDGGADAIIEAGYKPAMIVGDMDSVSDAALTSGAEIVVHAYRDGRAPGLDRIRALGQDCVVFPATGTSEDIAMLLADDKGAKLIVAVGTHATLVEFLDKGRAGMASTFLTRLRVGGKLVDAKGVSRLYRSQISTPSLMLLIGAAFITILGTAFVSPLAGLYWDVLRSYWDSFIFWVQGLFS